MPTALPATRLAAMLAPAAEAGPAYRDLADRIRVLVVDGRLPDGVRMPSERELAAAIGVSRTTTTRAYATLRDTGLLRSRQGSGHVVRVPLAASSASSLIVTPDDAGAIAMTFACPLAPPGLGRAFEAAADALPGLFATTGYLPDGLPVLRERLAQRYSDAGLPTDPAQIVVTTGSQGAISLLARTLLGPGRRVVVEATSYPHALDALTAAGARLAASPVGDTPWQAPPPLDRGGVDAAYLIPDFHNPTGAVMSDDERGGWARELRRHDVVPIIDEALREVNLDGGPLPPSFARYDRRAVLVGSASKWFWGGLRVGWIRAPHDLVMPLVQTRMTHDLGSAPFEQLVLAELLAGEEVARAGIDRLRTQRDHLLAELAGTLPELTAPRPPGGLSVWVTLPARVSSRLTSVAARHGLLLTPGPRFFARAIAAGERHLRLPYTHPPAVLTEAVHRLRASYLDLGRTATLDSPTGTLDLIA